MVQRYKKTFNSANFLRKKTFESRFLYKIATFESLKSSFSLHGLQPPTKVSHLFFCHGDIDDIGDIAILATFATSFFVESPKPYSHQFFEHVNYGVHDATCKVVVGGAEALGALMNL